MTPTAGECTTPESVLPAKYVGGASRRTFGPFRQFSSANDSVARDMTRLAALGLKGSRFRLSTISTNYRIFAPRCCRVSRARGCAMAAQRRADRPLNTRPNCLA